MELLQVKLIVEGALLAAGRALSLQELGKLFNPDGRPSNAQFREVLEQINKDCAERAFELREVGSGFRFQVRQEFGTWVSRLWEEKPARYSRALLETLALVAYRQPITRAEIEEVRGVAVSTNIIKTLLERSWIKVVGHRDTPGKPAMYATTREFLDYFNLNTLGELPSLADIKEITSLNQELELEAAMTVGIATPDAPDAPETAVAPDAATAAAGDTANETENQTDTNTPDATADQQEGAELETDIDAVEAENEVGDATVHSEDLEIALPEPETSHAEASTSEVGIHSVANNKIEDEAESDTLDDDSTATELRAMSQSNS